MLLRLVVQGWGSLSLVWDSHQRMPGRGCYVHAETACLSGLSRRGLLERAFSSCAEATGGRFRHEQVSKLTQELLAFAGSSAGEARIKGVGAGVRVRL